MLPPEDPHPIQEQLDLRVQDPSVFFAVAEDPHACGSIDSTTSTPSRVCAAASVNTWNRLPEPPQ